MSDSKKSMGEKTVFNMNKTLIETLTGLRVPDTVKYIKLNFSLEPYFPGPDNLPGIFIVMDNERICNTLDPFPSPRNAFYPRGLYRKFSKEMTPHMYNPENLLKHLKAFRALMSDEEYKQHWSMDN